MTSSSVVGASLFEGGGGEGESDALAEAGDALAEASDALAQSSDSLAQTSDSLAQTSDSLARTRPRARDATAPCCSHCGLKAVRPALGWLGSARATRAWARLWHACCSRCRPPPRRASPPRASAW
eukprot:2857081-Pyramimonas_sp.AAC.1